MSPPGGPRCPPALLALLLALVRSRELLECRERAVTAGGSLCLVPEEPTREWREIDWTAETYSGPGGQILTVTRDGNVSYAEGPFYGRVQFHLGVLSLCLSPVHKADRGVYMAFFKISSRILPVSHPCFEVSVWDPIPEPSLQSQILEWDRGWCLLSLLCSSPGDGNVSISWECPEDLPEFLEFPGSPSQRFQWVPEDAEPQMCLCNVSNAAGWRAAPAPLTCTGISGNFGLSAALGVSVGLILILILGFCCWRREEGEILGMVVRNVGKGGTVGNLSQKSGNAESKIWEC